MQLILIEVSGKAYVEESMEVVRDEKHVESYLKEFVKNSFFEPSR